MTTREEAKNRVKFDKVEFKFRFMSCMFTSPHWPGSAVLLYKNGNTIGEKHANKVNHHGEGGSSWWTLSWREFRKKFGRRSTTAKKEILRKEFKSGMERLT